MVKNSCFGEIMDEGNKPGFFKILRTSDLSSEFMRGIPHNIIRSISEKEFAYKMVLKLPWGRSWPIEISKNPHFYYLEKTGWEQFVNDNGLGDNESLTFTHMGNMCFTVNIYQIDCKEMLKPKQSASIASSSSGRNKREQLKNIYKVVKKEEIECSSNSRCSVPYTRLNLKRELNLGKKKVKEAKKKKEKVDTNSNDQEANTLTLVPEFPITIQKSYLTFLPIPKKFANMHMPEEKKVFKIHHSNGKKSWEVTYVSVQARFCAGWIRCARDMHLVVGDVCTFKLVKPTEMHVKVFKK